jgi:hydroxyquinol 1,2-dioxygenase
MIIRRPEDVTAKVLSELERAQDPRFREIMSSAVRHLHDWVREVKLTEEEFQKAAAIIARLGQLSDKSHNEVVLIAGSLGVSALVCLLNNGDHGKRETTANLLGPFWRAGSPRVDNGGSIVRSETAGAPMFVTAYVRDLAGNPVVGAEVDVWHTSGEGIYENQDPHQADWNLRGKFTTDEEGKIWFRSIKPIGYPIPVNGPVGDLLRAQGRHNLRPAHIHFLIYKPGYKTQFSQVYSSDDPNLETDSQFGVTQTLIAHYVLHDGAAEPTPAADVSGPWYSLDRHFVVQRGDAALPKPPITGKAEGPRPQPDVLPRR